MKCRCQVNLAALHANCECIYRIAGVQVNVEALHVNCTNLKWITGLHNVVQVSHGYADVKRIIDLHECCAAFHQNLLDLHANSTGVYW